MANLNPAPTRLATIRTPRALPGETKRGACFADDSKAALAFRAETQANFRYTSIQGAVPKW
jgi:hypothetical protein